MTLDAVTGTVVPALAAHGLVIHFDHDARRYVVSRDGETVAYVRRTTPSSRAYDSAFRVRHAAERGSLGTHVDGDLTHQVVPVIAEVIRRHDAHAAEQAAAERDLRARMAAAGHTDVLAYLLDPAILGNPDPAV